MSRTLAADPCPCGSGLVLASCCGPFLTGTAIPATALALMRSRYTAYARGDTPYLLATWHPSTRPASVESPAAAARWIGLDVRNHQSTGTGRAVVEFIARYKVAGRAQRLHETSRFVLEDGGWLYLDGQTPA